MAAAVNAERVAGGVEVYHGRDVAAVALVVAVEPARVPTGARHALVLAGHAPQSNLLAHGVCWEPRRRAELLAD